MCVRKIVMAGGKAGYLFVALVLAAGLLGPSTMDARATSPVYKQKGISLPAWGANTYAEASTDVSLAYLVATGADWVLLVATWYQQTIYSRAIGPRGITPSDESLVHIIDRAHDLGLKVMLKPHVDPETMGANSWRGQIGPSFTPEQFAEWFASYRVFIGHYAELAEQHGVEQFCIGTELLGTTKSEHAADWRGIAALVRSKFRGTITYAATRSELAQITWWDAVDYIGLDPYDELTCTVDPSVEDLRQAWAPAIAEFQQASDREGKPILFTEIGYRSTNGCACQPWNYFSDTGLDLQEQRNAYEALFESVWDKEWFAGIFWWFWYANLALGGPTENGYTPYEKPAEDVLRSWFLPSDCQPAPRPVPGNWQTRRIFGDSLAQGWQNTSWGVSYDLVSSPVYEGSQAISVAITEAWGALALLHPPLDASEYVTLEFSIQAATADLELVVFLYDGQGTELGKRLLNDCRYVGNGRLDVGQWKRVSIPLRDLGVRSQGLTRFAVQDVSGQTGGRFFIDEIGLAPLYFVHAPLIVK